ncbi:MAG: AIPR family protein [Verrucomicrobia bacterium]|nr:AIPR family protein [Verrucomicrobiota bacterium]
MDSRLWVALCRFSRDQIEVFNAGSGSAAEPGEGGAAPDPEDPLEFSRFCVYLAVHHLDLPVLHYQDAITEGKGELGLDGLVVAVGDQALGDPDAAAATVEELLESRTLFDGEGRLLVDQVPRPRILLMQVKREHFTPIRELDHFGASAHRFLTLETHRFQELRPNPGVLRWQLVYDRIRQVYEAYGIPFRPEIELIFAYAGVWRKDLAPEVARETAENRLRGEFSAEDVHFRMWGADELIEAIEWANKSVDGVLRGATLMALPGGVAKGFLGYAPATAIVELMPQRDGRPDERIFIDNVRSFLGDSGDNVAKINPGAMGLLESLEKGEADQILLRHNGLTITARRAELQADGALLLHQFQIVNGAQTAFILSRHRHLIDAALVSVKIVVTEDDEVKNGVILGANTQSMVNAYDMLARRREVRALQQGFDAIAWHRPDRIWLQRRRREWIPRDAYATQRFVTLRNLMEAFASACLAAPHRVHSDSGSLLGEVPDKIFSMAHAPSVYRAMGWLSVAGRIWAQRHQLVWVDQADGRGSRSYPARHQFVFALWLLVDPGPADTGLSRAVRGVNERFEAACRLLAGAEGEKLAEAAGQVVQLAAGPDPLGSALARSKDFTDRVRTAALRWRQEHPPR